ncbi:MAG: CidA/LrgA family protein [Clostridiaceae bacterium]|nr:CidA/LrgA family protein [Clostridiaceae bacterium]
MKYLRQSCIIIGFSLLGELLNWLLPLPIPAAIYGLLLLFIALSFRVLKVEMIREMSNFLIVIMPLLFVAPSVNILECWPILEKSLLPIFLIILVSTVITFGISGWITQLILSRKERGRL